MTLTELIEKARRERKWLHCTYQDMWFSPDELQKENEGGNFRWGAQNFELRDPQEHSQQLERRIKEAEEELVRFEARRR